MRILDRLLRRKAVSDEQPPAFGGNLFQCRRCGSLALGAWGGYHVFYSEARGTCKKDCDFVPVSEKRALSSSGMSDKELLEKLYSILNRPDLMKISDHPKPLLEEVERRLGLGKPATEDLPEFQRQSTTDVHDAVRLLRDGALPATPIISRARVEAEYQDMVSAWGCRGLKGGTPQDIADTLRRNLERDSKLPRFRNFSVQVIADQYCAQVYSSFEREPGARYATATAYRIWRTSDSVFFCGSKDAIL